MIPSISQSAVTGIQRGLQQANHAAGKLASAANATGMIEIKEVSSSLVDLTIAKHQVQASAKVIQTENQLRGSLLDIKV